MNPLGLEAVGAITGLGEDVRATIGAIFTESQSLSHLSVESVHSRPVMGMPTSVPKTVSGIDRLTLLGGTALREATGKLPAQTEIGLLVCAPTEEVEEGITRQSSALLARLATEAKLKIAPKVSRIFPGGRGAIFKALDFAQSTLQSHHLAGICLLGIDSLITPARLRRGLPQGAFPGEAAAAVLLAPHPGPRSMAILAGFWADPGPSAEALGQHASQGGMKAAIERTIALAGQPAAPFGTLIHDLPATQAGFLELIWAKNSSALQASQGLLTLSPSFSVGEVGAASGVLSLVTLAFLMDKEAILGPGLCLFMDEGSRCGAVMLVPSTYKRKPKP